MDSTNILYQENASLQNQGVFSGDGNKYRFDFNLWSGDKVPGGDPSQNGKTYYAFSVGNVDDPNYNGGRNTTCWIEKTVFVNKSSYGNLFKIYELDSGFIIIAHGDAIENVVGVIAPSRFNGYDGLWGMNILSASPYVFDEETVGVFNTTRLNFIKSGGIEAVALLYTGLIDTNNDLVTSIQREDCLLFDKYDRKPSRYTLVPTFNEADASIVTSLRLGLTGDRFEVVDKRLSVLNVHGDTTKLENVDDYNGSGGYDLVIPDLLVNTEPYTSSMVLIEIDETTHELINSQPSSDYSPKLYSGDLLSLLSENGTLNLFAICTEEDNEFGGKHISSVALDYSTDTISGSETEKVVLLCSVSRFGGIYSITQQNQKSITLEGGALILTVPFGDPITNDPTEIEELIEVVNEDGKIEIDLNSEETQTNIPLLAQITGLSEGVYNVPANFVNARYMDGGIANLGSIESLGVVRLSKEHSILPFKVALAGVNIIPDAETDVNKIYGFNSNGQWGLYQLDGAVYIPATGEEIAKYRVLPLGHNTATMFYDQYPDDDLPEGWFENMIMTWQKERTISGVKSGGNLILDFSESGSRNSSSSMPGITMYHPGAPTIPVGIFANVETNGGPRVDVGWGGGANGGNFELYGPTGDRAGQFRMIIGPTGFYEFKQYNGTTWYTIGGMSKEGRFFCGYKDTGFPGSGDATGSQGAPSHPLQIFNEQTSSKIVSGITKEGRGYFGYFGTSTPAPEHPVEIYDENTSDPTLVAYISKGGKIATKKEVSGTITHVLQLDPIDINFETETAKSQTIKIREMVIPYVNGGTVKGKLTQVMCGEGYGAELELGGGSLEDGTAVGDVKVWNGTIWENVTTSTLDVVTHVDFTGGKLVQNKKSIKIIGSATNPQTTDIVSTVAGAGAVSTSSTLNHTHL